MIYSILISDLLYNVLNDVMQGDSTRYYHH